MTHYKVFRSYTEVYVLHALNEEDAINKIKQSRDSPDDYSLGFVYRAEIADMSK